MTATTIPTLKIPNPANTCPWCRRIVNMIDGRRDLSSIARELFLPSQVVVKLVNTLVSEGQVELHAAPTPLWQELHQTLQLVVPERANDTLQSAVNMTRHAPQNLSQSHLPDLLLALELSLPCDDYQAFTLHWAERQSAAC